MVRVAILVGSKGRGSNMRALVENTASHPEIKIVKVIGSRSDAPALEVALELGVDTEIVEFGDDYPERLLASLSNIDWVCLAGYLKLFPSQVLQAFQGRVLNIHPALLPKFGGKGMFGQHVHEAVVAARETESGCTVHYVTDEYDEGAIIRQARCEVTPDDTAETLAAKVLKLEHRLFSEVLKELAVG